MSLELARGDYCMQWDDDEWCHPERIAAQMTGLAGGAGASLLFTHPAFQLNAEERAAAAAFLAQSRALNLIAP